MAVNEEAEEFFRSSEGCLQLAVCLLKNDLQRGERPTV